MSSAFGAVADVAQRGWAWWSSEISSMLPGFSRSRDGRSRAGLIVAFDSQGLLRIAGSGTAARKLRLAPDQEAIEEALVRLGRTRPGTKVVLGLTSGAVLERSIEIPASARREAQAMLALDLERSTPFKARDVFVAHRLAPSSRNGWLKATQFVVKRKTVDDACQRLQSFGLSVDGVDCLNEDGEGLRGLDLYASGAGEPSKPVRVWPGRLMGAALVALASSAVITSISRREAALADLEAAVATARSKAETVGRTITAVEAKQRQLAEVREMKTSRPLAVEIIDELTRLLPDDVVINEFKLEGNTIDFSGLAKSAATVVGLIERSSMFRDVELTAPVAFDAASDKERIGLRAKLRLATKSASAAATPEDAERAQ